VLGGGKGARVLGSVEIRPADGLYDYDAKYRRVDTNYVVPAPLPDGVQRRIAELALAAHRLLECSGATRTEFLWDGAGEPVVLEINTIPGLTSHSLLPKIAAHTGMSYADLVEAMLEDASLKQV
jgi:D-alanine-D-alanine ligase